VVIEIHSSASVASTARLGEGTVVGPFSVVEEGVILGSNNQMGPYVVIHKGTTMGSNNLLRVGAVVGGTSQDKKARDDEGRLWVGDDNVIGEYVTLHRGTEHGGGITKIGSRGVIGTFTHVGHDVEIQDDVILGPLNAISGHVTLQRGVRTGAHVGIHQFVRMGAWSEAGNCTGHGKDVPPFCLATGSVADQVCLREDLSEVLKLDERRIQGLKAAFQVMIRTQSFTRMLEELERLEKTEEVREILSFLREEGHRFPERKRGILRRAAA